MLKNVTILFNHSGFTQGCIMKPHFILTKNTLHNIFLTAEHHNYAIKLAIIFFGIILFAVSAQITLPYYPFSTSLLDLAALFCAMAFGPLIALAIFIIYIFMGLIGLPILINHTQGLQELLTQHAGGYYLSLVPTILLTGYLTEHGWGRHFTSSFCTAALGMLLFMLMDGLIISLQFGINTIWTHAISPVLEINLFKIIALSIVIPRIWKTMNEPLHPTMIKKD